MKYRAKFDALFVKKGEIYEVNDKGWYGINLCSTFYEITPKNYPDLFEPVGEKSNYEKWSEILKPYIKKITSAAVESWKRMPSKFYEEELDIEIRSLNIFLSERLDADKIYKEVCGEG